MCIKTVAPGDFNSSHITKASLTNPATHPQPSLPPGPAQPNPIHLTNMRFSTIFSATILAIAFGATAAPIEVRCPTGGSTGGINLLSGNDVLSGQQVDGSGNPVFDGNGNPVFKGNGNGNGNPVATGNGNPSANGNGNPYAIGNGNPSATGNHADGNNLEQALGGLLGNTGDAVKKTSEKAKSW
ncbi:hypothetical protein IAU60_001150 [Kwoniella sp. DSM 27419]